MGMIKWNHWYTAVPIIPIATNINTGDIILKASGKPSRLAATIFGIIVWATGTSIFSNLQNDAAVYYNEYNS